MYLIKLYLLSKIKTHFFKTTLVDWILIVRISVYDLRKTLVARLGYQTTNPGSPGHISGSPRNSLKYVLEIDGGLLLLKNSPVTKLC